MPKPEPAAPAPLEVSQRDALPLTGPQTVTWIPTRADTIETDADGNVLAVNGVPVGQTVVDDSTRRVKYTALDPVDI